MPPKKYIFWEWRNDHDEDSSKKLYTAFKKEDSLALEKAFRSMDSSSPSMAHLTINKVAYNVDLIKMNQTNAESGFVRAIRRQTPKNEQASVDAPSMVAVWEWERHHGKGDFVPFGMKVSQQIEDAFLADSLKVVIPGIIVSAHETLDVEMHLGYMHQKNLSGKHSGKTRTIRRVMKPRDELVKCIQAEAPPSLTSLLPGKASSTTAGAALGSKTARVETVDETASIKKPRVETSKTLPDIAKNLSDWFFIGGESTMVLDMITPSLTAQGASKGTAVKIASFDMDDTLIMPASGKVFPTGRTDWKWLHPSVVPKLQELYNSGHHLVIISNQAGIAKKAFDESKANEIKGKIIDIMQNLKLPVSAWVSTDESNYRKPSTTMFEHLQSTISASGCVLDAPSSFYCGDAGGRTIMTMANRKKDFSCSDRKFAYNINLSLQTTDANPEPPKDLAPIFKFFTPEEYFLGHAPDTNFHWDGVGPDELLSLPRKYPENIVFHNTKQQPELVLFVGFPGCGKTTVFRRYFEPHGYIHANRDTLKTTEKCAEVASASLKSGRSVVVDNTNPSVEDRAKFTSVAKALNVPCRCFYFTASPQLSNHMNVMRGKLGITPRVSSIVYNIYKSKFSKPSPSEGFSEVTDVPTCVNFDGLPPAAQRMFFQLS